jgi:CRP-like cAMP-binding protein
MLGMPFAHQPGSTANNGESGTAALLSFLHQSGQLMTFSADEILFLEGSPCNGAYFVEEGAVELTIASGERRMHVGSAHPGQLVGITSVLTGSPSQSTATAMLKTKVVFVKAEVMREYLKTHAEICLHTVQLLGADIVDLAANAIRPLRLQPRFKPHS